MRATPHSSSSPGGHLQFRIGTIGFSYPGWQGSFYPAGVSSSDYLAAYASAFDTVELDTTFYGIPAPARVEKWAATAPAGFQFCVKTPRDITHESPLAAQVAAMHAFLRALEPLRDARKLGPVLLQFPPTFLQLRHDELHAFLGTLPAGFRYAVELRHRSWLEPATAKLLAAHNAAWVAADYSRNPWPLELTADFVYLRFVGRHHRFPANDREEIDVTDSLTAGRARLAAATPLPGTPVYALFANDYAGHAPATANRFRPLMGLTPRGIAEVPSDAQGRLF